MNLPKIKKLLVGILTILMLATALVGCGASTSVEQSQTNTDSTVTNEADNEIDNTDIDNSADENTDDIYEPNIYEYETGSNRRFQGVLTGIEVTGIEEFESLKTDIYEDCPAEGNVYVVIYMDLTNNTQTPYYFAPDFCEFVVDGQSTTTTYLVNEPKKDYETIFGYVEQGATGYYYDRRGFLVIEAPKDWQNLEFKYTGWNFDEYANAIIINRFTRADLEKSE